jgi:nucleotide-binding universal stress UspA family protein
MNIRTVLHATDFSAASRHAFELACSLARDHGARLVVLNVIETPYRVVEPGLPPFEVNELRAEAEHWFSTLPTPAGDIPLKKLIAEGDPVTEILRVAAEEQADFIVLGTHGRTGVQRLLTGSVAENVIRRAQCPVVVVKTPHRHPHDKANARDELADTTGFPPVTKTVSGKTQRAGVGQEEVTP